MFSVWRLRSQPTCTCILLLINIDFVGNYIARETWTSLPSSLSTPSLQVVGVLPISFVGIKSDNGDGVKPERRKHQGSIPKQKTCLIRVLIAHSAEPGQSNTPTNCSF